MDYYATLVTWRYQFDSDIGLQEKDMRNHETLSFWCKTDQHNVCGHTWNGAYKKDGRDIPAFIICNCPCGHKSQKLAKKRIKQLNRDYRNRGKDLF